MCVCVCVCVRECIHTTSSAITPSRNETFRVLPCLDYCKQCCNEHWDALIFLDYVFFPDICPQVGLLDHMIVLLEKAMAPHSSTLAWKTPWAEEPGRLQSMGSQRVGHDWATSLSLFIFMHWRRKWQPIPVFLPGESQGRGSLVGCRHGIAESDTTEAT